MKKRSTIIFVTTVVLLSGIGLMQWTKGPENKEQQEKQVFYISTEALDQKEDKWTIVKTASVGASSDITVSAQVPGRVNTISVWLWQKVWNRQTLLSMSDTAGSYSFGAQKASLSVQSAQNNYEINRQNLEKQIQDAQLAYQKTLITSQSSILWGSGTTADLQLQKLQQDLEKARFDYNAKLKSDEQTLENYINTSKNVYSDVSNLMLDVIDQSDKFLGYTVANAHLNNWFEAYISVKDDNTKYNAETKLANLILEKDKLIALWSEITLDNVTGFLAQYKTIVKNISEMTVAMKNVFNTTTPGGTLTQTSLDAYIASFSALQSKASTISSSITSQINAIDLFVTTYQDNQSSLQRQIWSLETQIAVSKNQLQDASKSADITIQQSENNVDFLKDTQNNNLEMLRNSLKQSQVAYQEAQFNLWKFSVNSPIEGTIKEVLVDQWQEVNAGTPLFKIVSQGKEIEVKVTAEEKQYMRVGQEVEIVYEDVVVTGQVSEMASVADSTANYLVKISLGEKVGVDIGSFVTVKIPLQWGNTVIPLNAVTIVDNNRWQIFLWDGVNIVVRTVDLGSVYGKGIEVNESFETGLELIVSDISRYDGDKMSIQKR